MLKEEEEEEEWDEIWDQKYHMDCVSWYGWQSCPLTCL
jgi:hypothetical protein